MVPLSPCPSDCCTNDPRAAHLSRLMIVLSTHACMLHVACRMFQLLATSVCL